MISFLKGLAFDPYPLRSLTLRLMQKFNLGTYATRLEHGLIDRPHYGYCLFNGALLARRLGYKRISVLEFGVAGGRGLISLEYHAENVKEALSIEIDIYGFDTGRGLPKPVDYRDLPYHWKEGFFAMDMEKLRGRLKKAQLIIGDIKETAQTFCAQYNPAPIAAVIHDFDLYSSTAEALKLFDAPEQYFLPRVFCYFDDTVGSEVELYNDYTGERLAINEFNETHDTRKIAVPYHLLTRRIREVWHHQVFIYHDFAHSRYNDFVSNENQQLHLSD